MCSCGSGIEVTEYFLLHVYSFSFQKSAFSDNFQNIDSSFLSLNLKNEVTFLLHGLPNNTNNLIKMLFCTK